MKPGGPPDEAEFLRARQSLRRPRFGVSDVYLHVVKQLPVPEVSKRLGVKDPQVHFAKYKVGALMRREIKRLDRQHF